MGDLSGFSGCVVVRERQKRTLYVSQLTFIESIVRHFSVSTPSNIPAFAMYDLGHKQEN